MASSPYWNTSNEYIKYDIYIRELSTSTADNTSTVRVQVLAWRTNTGYTTNYGGSCSCTIDGTGYSSSWSYPEKPISYNSDTVLFDKTLDIPHNEDGTKALTISASFSLSNGIHGGPNSYTFTLTNIARKAIITNAPNFSDTDNPTLSYTLPDASLVTTFQACISADNSTPTVAYRDINKTGNSYTFNLTTAERDALLQATANDNTSTVYFIIKTVLAGTTYYTSAARTFSATNANPTMTGVSYQDVNSTSTAITQDNQIIIQNYSSLQFNFAELNAYKYATLVSITATVNAVTKTLSLSGTSQTNKILSFGSVNAAQNLDATIVLTDSRGNKATQTLQITIAGYKTPTAVVTCAREQNFYTESDLSVKADYSSINGRNTITITHYEKQLPSGGWSSGTTMSDGSTVVLSLANTSAWQVKVVVADAFSSSEYVVGVGKGIPIVFFDVDRRSLSVNCFPVQENSFELNGEFVMPGMNFMTFQSVIADQSEAVAGWNKIAQIKIVNTYANMPIEFLIYQRGLSVPISLYLRFVNENGTNPDVSTFGYTDSTFVPSQFEAFMYKSEPSTWEMYVKKIGEWDQIAARITVAGYMRDKTQWSFEQKLITTKPTSGVVDAVLL